MMVRALASQTGAACDNIRCSHSVRIFHLRARAAYVDPVIASLTKAGQLTSSW